MYFKQADMFWGMDRDFVAKIMKLAESESHDQGKILFSAGSPADHFYVLIKGHVKLSIGDTGHIVHIVSKAGEAFGWSSLIGREVYSAGAECLNPTSLLKIDGEKLRQVLAQDPANGLEFFRHLSAILGKRLLQSYSMISSLAQSETSVSFGTRQVLETETTQL